MQGDCPAEMRASLYLEVTGTTAGRNLEATIEVNCGNATAEAGGPPKSPMAKAAIMGCLSPGRSSEWRHFGKKGKTVS